MTHTPLALHLSAMRKAHSMGSAPQSALLVHPPAPLLVEDALVVAPVDAVVVPVVLVADVVVDAVLVAPVVVLATVEVDPLEVCAEVCDVVVPAPPLPVVVPVDTVCPQLVPRRTKKRVAKRVFMGTSFGKGKKETLPKLLGQSARGKCWRLDAVARVRARL